ncbi:MAG: TFIIB-type zinc ribbon-containing protein [Dehalococcoidales bacterium]|jgi:transcription initiation factor TFIIIB Brf1 subunit/transcription initiation factor TFIIB|nr:TFIIB-type zinc ribbon-containing protein [Dehalococcoidales bacterium]
MNMQCPLCKSPRFVEDYPNIVCLDCRHTEVLIDFPISHDWHRYYLTEAGKADPGSSYLPPEPAEERPGTVYTVDTLRDKAVARMGEESRNKALTRSLVALDTKYKTALDNIKGLNARVYQLSKQQNKRGFDKEVVKPRGIVELPKNGQST